MDKNIRLELARYLIRLRADLAWVIFNTGQHVNKEELEFNGRWCDDGGRNIE